MKTMTTSSISISYVLDNIRHLRRGKEYSQQYIAFRLGISQNAYSKLEGGKTVLTLERLFEISNILNIAPTKLLEEDRIRVNWLVN